MSVLIPFDFVEAHLTADDDPEFWQTALSVLADEFAILVSKPGTEKDWAMLVGACSHWRRPHQERWTVAGGFAWPSENRSFPNLDWSMTLLYRDGELLPVPKLPGKGIRLFRVAMPSRTRRHKQAAVRACWGNTGESVLFGFRCMNAKWRCVAVSDLRSGVTAPVHLPLAGLDISDSGAEPTSIGSLIPKS